MCAAPAVEGVPEGWGRAGMARVPVGQGGHAPAQGAAHTVGTRSLECPSSISQSQMALVTSLHTLLSSAWRYSGASVCLFHHFVAPERL